MKETQETSNEEKKSQKEGPLSSCGGFQKMAEMMKSCCPTEDGILDCCSLAARMMRHGKQAHETKEKTEKAEETAET